MPRSLPTSGAHRRSSAALTTSPPLVSQQRVPRSIGALPSRLPQPFQDPPASILSDPMLAGNSGDRPLTAAQLVQRGLRKEAAAAAAAGGRDDGSILMSPPQSRQNSVVLRPRGSGAPRRLVPGGGVDVRDVRDIRDIRTVRAAAAAAAGRDVRDVPVHHRPSSRPPMPRGSAPVAGIGMRKRSLSDHDLTAVAAAAAAADSRKESSAGASLSRISLDKPTTAMQLSR